MSTSTSQSSAPSTGSGKLTSIYRTHTCGELTEKNIGEKVRLSGWVLRKRDHGGVIFIDLRDHYGITQVVFDAASIPAAQNVRSEFVLQIEGSVVARVENSVNAKLSTGSIEIQATSLSVHSEAEILPFQISEDHNDPEATKLRYRFLELRREKVHSNIILRSKIISAMREIMTGMGFNEFQTPILTSSSPEGARDFIVPSRLHPGKFYALPQAPQQFKQLLMVAGFDRYFQIAPCFRDEDARADRSPGEFYQLDFEMSFVEQQDVLDVLENLFDALFKKFSSLPISPRPYVHIPYLESFERFGTDKPDLRIPYEIKNITSVFENTGFKVFKEILASGGSIKAIACPLTEIPSRKYFDDLIGDFTKEYGFGVAYLAFSDTETKGSILKFVSPEEQQAIRQQLNVSGNTAVFLLAGDNKKITMPLGRLRVKLGHDFKAIDKDAWKLCFITDFPFYEANEETGKPDFAHNPFSMPRGGMEALNTKNPFEIFANQYDLVINGIEIVSGAIRNHSPEIMYKAFEIAGYGKEVVDEKFGGMIRAFKFGAPPHGGAAPGVDRIVMLLSGEEMIREVIAFPLAQNGEDLLMAAPSRVNARQLRDVHIKLDLPPDELKGALSEK